LNTDWVFVKDIKHYDGKVVTLKGWLYNMRSSGKIWFLLLRDGTGLIQGIVSPVRMSVRKSSTSAKF